MEETTGQLLRTILEYTLLYGGFLAAAWLWFCEKRNPPDCVALTEKLAARAWSTGQALALFGALFGLYLAAGLVASFIAPFLYESQIPLAKLVITLLIYALVVVMAAIIVHRRGGDWSANLGLGGRDLKKIPYALFAYLVAIPFIMLITKGYHFLLERLSGVEPDIQEVAKIVSGELSWVRICYMLTAMIAAPLYEELIFRGVIFPWCVKRAGLVPGVAIVSVLFAAAHAHAPSYVPLALLSVTLCLAFWRTGSLWVSIGVHMIFNTVSVLALNLR